MRVQLPPITAAAPLDPEPFEPGDAYEPPEEVQAPAATFPREMSLAEIVHFLVLNPEVGRFFQDAKKDYSRRQIERYMWLQQEDGRVIRIQRIWEDMCDDKA
jgi:hypothetical protein